MTATLAQTLTGCSRTNIAWLASVVRPRRIALASFVRLDLKGSNALVVGRFRALRLVLGWGERIFLPVVESEVNWPEALRAADNSAAVASLRGILLKGLRIALRDRKDVSEAQLEDFTQEALLRILDQLDRFAGRSKFTTWAHSVAINTAFTELRRKRWQDVSLDALTEAGWQLAEPMAMPDHALGDDEERVRLVEALRKSVAEKLSDNQRTAILGVLQGLPMDQLVQLLGTNRNSAYKLLHDARRALKQHLAAEGFSAETIRTAFAA